MIIMNRLTTFYQYFVRTIIAIHRIVHQTRTVKMNHPLCERTHKKIRFDMIWRKENDPKDFKIY